MRFRSDLLHTALSGNACPWAVTQPHKSASNKKRDRGGFEALRSPGSGPPQSTAPSRSLDPELGLRKPNYCSILFLMFCEFTNQRQLLTSIVDNLVPKPITYLSYQGAIDSFRGVCVLGPRLAEVTLTCRRWFYITFFPFKAFYFLPWQSGILDW